MAVSLQLWVRLNIFAITMLSPRARALSWRGARSRRHALRIDCILGAIPVFPRQRQTIVAPWLSEQRLVHVQATSAESMSRTGHVEAPYPVSSIIRDPARLICMSFQTPDPLVECQGIVLAQAL